MLFALVSTPSLPSSAAAPSGSQTALRLTHAYGPELVVPELGSDSPVVMPDVAKAVIALERQGKGRKVISMALYGANPRYTQGAIENAMLTQRDWPGWTLRVYYGDNVPKEVLQTIRSFGAETVSARAYKPDASMMWRFFAIEDRSATRVIFRDADARLTRRDRTAVKEWMSTEYPLHTMHDHFWHESAIMGGMWGVVSGFLNPTLLEPWREAHKPSAAARRNETARWGQDQDWLRSVVWPLVRNATLSHASWHCKANRGAEWRPFPTLHTHARDFVGQVYSVESEYQGDFVVEPCPRECRKPNSTGC